MLLVFVMVLIIEIGKQPSKIDFLSMNLNKKESKVYTLLSFSIEYDWLII